MTRTASLLVRPLLVLALLGAVVGCSGDDSAATMEVRPVTEPSATFDLALADKANCGFRARSHLAVLDPMSGQAQWTVEVPWLHHPPLLAISDDTAPGDPATDDAVAVVVVVSNRRSAQPTLAGVALTSGEPRWQRDLHPPTGPIPSTAMAVGPVAITGEADALLALDPASGEEAWRVDIEDFTGVAVGHERREVQEGNEEAQQADEAASEAMLVLHDGNEVRRLEPGTGEVVWSAPVDDHPALPPLLTDDLVIVGGMLHAMVALDLDTGAPRWEHPPEYDRTLSAVAATDEVLVVTDRAGTWPMVAADDPDDRFTAIDLATGEVAWRAAPRAVSNEAQIVGDLLIAPVGSELAAFDAGTGEQRWWIHTGPSQKMWAMGADHLLVAFRNFENDTSTFGLLDRASGQERWQQAVPFVATNDAVLVDDAGQVDDAVLVEGATAEASLSEPLVIVGGATRHDAPDPGAERGGALWGFSLGDGAQRWRSELPEAATTLLSHPEGLLALSSDPPIGC